MATAQINSPASMNTLIGSLSTEIDQEAILRLKQPKQILEVSIPVRMDDGTEGECGPDDTVTIDPGHDAWVVGDAPCVVVDFGIAPTYAQHQD